MSSYTTEVKNLHFNAATGQFEALVVFHEGHESRSYPVSIRRSISAEFETVSRDLVAYAKAMRNREARHLVSHRRRTAGAKVAHITDIARDLLNKSSLGGQRRAA